MSNLLKTLPGIPVSVADMPRQLASLWNTELDDGAPSEVDMRASQLNLIVCLGEGVNEAQAQAHFQTAVQFAQRTPCRIIVLCPQAESANAAESAPLESKLFSQCYVGEDLRNMCCCEAMVLGYTPTAQPFLASQVSVWLESDLPTYVWASGVKAGSGSASVLGGLLKTIKPKKLITDRPESLAGLENLDTAGIKLQNLATARTLPMRQALGQFLSGQPSAQLTEGFTSISLQAAANWQAEATVLGQWFAGCMQRAGAPAVEVHTLPLNDAEDAAAPAIHLTAQYQNNQHFEAAFTPAVKRAKLSGNFSGQAFELPVRVSCPSPEEALSAALFY